MLNIIADENMPYVHELFAELGNITLVNGRQLTPEQVKEADVLLVRSVTKVNESLISQATKLQFVGSATIGTDHVDTQYLASRNIFFTNAPGCNATSVGEYAFIALLELANRFDQPLKGKTVGIVGAGNTGSAAEKCFKAYGLEVLVCDPIKALHDKSRDYVSLDTIIAKADVISLHVPITKTGEHPTWHLFDAYRLATLRPNTWLLNCCRGEVIDNEALYALKQQRDDIKLVLDVWENEPNPLAKLVPYVEFGTPHIAGYSLEGKARGTYMLYQALCEQLVINAGKQLNDLLPKHNVSSVTLSQQLSEQQLLKICRLVFDLRDDDALFREKFMTSQGFDHLRKTHTHRREFSALKIDAVNATNDCKKLLSALGFSQ